MYVYVYVCMRVSVSKQPHQKWQHIMEENHWSIIFFRLFGFFFFCLCCTLSLRSFSTLLLLWPYCFHLRSSLSRNLHQVVSSTYTNALAILVKWKKRTEKNKKFNMQTSHHSDVFLDVENNVLKKMHDTVKRSGNETGVEWHDVWERDIKVAWIEEREHWCWVICDIRNQIKMK